MTQGPARLARASRALLALALLPLAGACVRYGGPSNLRRDLSREAGVELDAHFAMTVTRSGVALARMFTDEEEVPLGGVRRVEIGVYEVKGLRRGVESTSPLEPRDLPGLTPVARVHEEDEDIFVLVGEDEAGEIRQLVVIVAEPEEWVLVRVRGKLRRTVEQALRLAFERTDRGDRYEPVLEAYRQGEAQRAEISPGRTDREASAAGPSRPSS
jgi:hypothetical protein